MDYVRDDIKRYWGIAYRRSLGVALIALSIILAVGIAFTALQSTVVVSNYYDYFVFWILIAIIGVITLLSSFYHSHVSSVKLMNETEHSTHSRHMGIWMISIVLGVIVFIVPLLFVSASIEALYILFSLGGIFWILYGTVRAIFKHSYEELAIGASAFWIMFAFGLYQLSMAVPLNLMANTLFTIYFAAMSITVIAGFVGLALIINSSREAMGEFTSRMKPSATSTSKKVKKARK
jgi:uncharacterized membrane protein HdeD (DUF308 family)